MAGPTEVTTDMEIDSLNASKILRTLTITLSLSMEVLIEALNIFPSAAATAIVASCKMVIATLMYAERWAYDALLQLSEEDKDGLVQTRLPINSYAFVVREAKKDSELYAKRSGPYRAVKRVKKKRSIKSSLR